jgi:hypothetical protein
VLIEELRATICFRVMNVLPRASRVTNRELVQWTIPDDDEDAAVAILFVANKLEPRRRTGNILKPLKGQLDVPKLAPTASLDGVEECISQRVCDQLSPQTSVLITAMTAPAPAAAIPLRKDSFFETCVKKLVSF